MIATFSEQELPDDLQYRMKQSKTWSPKCPVPMHRLRLLQMQHYNFFGEQMLGSMVVLDKVALSVLAIFEDGCAILDCSEPLAVSRSSPSESLSNRPAG